jgi:hypothetical protein
MEAVPRKKSMEEFYQEYVEKEKDTVLLPRVRVKTVPREKGP